MYYTCTCVTLAVCSSVLVVCSSVLLTLSCVQQCPPHSDVFGCLKAGLVVHWTFMSSGRGRGGDVGGCIIDIQDIIRLKFKR